MSVLHAKHSQKARAVMNQSNSISRTIVNNLKRTSRKSINWIIVTGLIACLLIGALLRTPSVAASVQASFAAHNDFATGPSPRSIAEGDFNRDGKLDLAVVNSGGNSDTVSILLGTGTGTFGAKTDFATGSQPTSIAVSEFKAGAKPALAATNADCNPVS